MRQRCSIIDEITIGRDVHSSIVISSKYISNHHCTIYTKPTLRIIDHQSTNGTYVNGMQVNEASLKQGDCILLHGVKIVVMNPFLLIATHLDIAIHLDFPPLFVQSVVLNTFQPRIVEKPSLTIELEAPPGLVINSSHSMVMSIGPSITMSGTMLFALLMNEHASMSSMVMIIGMAISMILWPIVHRRKENKITQNKNALLKAHFQDYLSHLDAQIEEYRFKEIDYYENNTDLLMIGRKDIPLNLHFVLPHMGFEKNELEALLVDYVNQERILKNMPERVNLFDYQHILLTGDHIREYLIYLSIYVVTHHYSFSIIGDIPCELSFLKYMHSTDQKIYLNLTNSRSPLTPCIDLNPLQEYDLTINILNLKHDLKLQEEDFLLVNANNTSKTHDSLLSVLGLHKIEQLNILDYYKCNKTYEGIKVQLSDTIELDLHESGDGPHGLLAGMTGSGKSELLITLILNLCTRYAPTQLSFFLIDYKGGGLSEVFKYNGQVLPHILHSISNLDENELMRGIYGLKNEVVKRQKIFNEIKEKLNISRMDIDQYHRLYELKKVEIPLPHIMIIVDEFAELKGSNLDMIEELIHLSRIGRSLGFHLLLTTQKPSGVVNQQIWSNTNYHICMKVQDVSDSNEMIHSKEGAYLSSPGEFYLQKGMNQELVYGRCIYLGNRYEPTDQVEIVGGKKQYDLSESDALIRHILSYHLESSTALYQSSNLPIIKIQNNQIGMIDDYKHSRYLPLMIQLNQGNIVVYGNDRFEYLDVIQAFIEQFPIYEIEAGEDPYQLKSLFTTLLQSNQQTVLIVRKVQGLFDSFIYEKELTALFQKENMLWVVFAKSHSEMKYSYEKYFKIKILFTSSINEFHDTFNTTQSILLYKQKGRGIIQLDDYYPFQLGRKEN